MESLIEKNFDFCPSYYEFYRPSVPRVISCLLRNLFVEQGKTMIENQVLTNTIEIRNDLSMEEGKKMIEFFNPLRDKSPSFRYFYYYHQENYYLEKYYNPLYLESWIREIISSSQFSLSEKMLRLESSVQMITNALRVAQKNGLQHIPVENNIVIVPLMKEKEDSYLPTDRGYVQTYGYLPVFYSLANTVISPVSHPSQSTTSYFSESKTDSSSLKTDEEKKITESTLIVNFQNYFGSLIKQINPSLAQSWSEKNFNQGNLIRYEVEDEKKLIPTYVIHGDIERQQKEYDRRYRLANIVRSYIHRIMFLYEGMRRIQPAKRFALPIYLASIKFYAQACEEIYEKTQDRNEIFLPEREVPEGLKVPASLLASDNKIISDRRLLDLVKTIGPATYQFTTEDKQKLIALVYQSIEVVTNYPVPIAPEIKVKDYIDLFRYWSLIQTTDQSARSVEKILDVRFKTDDFNQRKDKIFRMLQELSQQLALKKGTTNNFFTSFLKWKTPRIYSDPLWLGGIEKQELPVSLTE